MLYLHIIESSNLLVSEGKDLLLQAHRRFDLCSSEVTVLRRIMGGRQAHAIRPLGPAVSTHYLDILALV